MKRGRIDSYFKRAFNLSAAHAPPPPDVLSFWDDLLPELRPAVRAYLDIRSRTRLARTCRAALAAEDHGRALAFPSTWVEKVWTDIGINRHLIPTFLRALFDLGWHRWPEVEHVTMPIVDILYPMHQDMADRAGWIKFAPDGECIGHCGRYPIFEFRLRHSALTRTTLSARWSTLNTLDNLITLVAREYPDFSPASLHGMRLITPEMAEATIRAAGERYRRARQDRV
jgi:hypothetical protein